MDTPLDATDSVGDVRENTSAFALRGLLNLRMLGFGLNRAWVYLLFIGAAASAVTWNGEMLPQAAFNVSTLALCLTLAVPAFLEYRIEQVAWLAPVRVVCPAILCLGTLVLASATLPGAPTLALCVVGGVLTGAGSGCVDLGYAELYRNTDPRTTCLEVPLSFLLAATVFTLTRLLDPVMGCVVTSLIPLASGAILFGRYRVWSPGTEPAVEPQRLEMAPFALRVGVCAALVGAADGVVRAVFLQAQGSTAEELYMPALFWASLVTLAVIWACALAPREFDMVGTYKIAMLIMAFFFQMLPIFAGYPIQNVIALAGYGTFNALIWILLASLANRFRLSSVVVFGVGWSMITLGVFVGSWLGDAVCAWVGEFTPSQLSAVALLATTAVLLSYMFVLKDSDVERMTAESQTPSGQRTDGNGASRPRFVDGCQALAQRYGLTPRETQVMILYAKGRSYNRIQEELDLSRSTVTTHLSHIYQKMGVHSKQEFVDLIEGRVKVV